MEIWAKEMWKFCNMKLIFMNNFLLCGKSTSKVGIQTTGITFSIDPENFMQLYWNLVKLWRKNCVHFRVREIYQAESAAVRPGPVVRAPPYLRAGPAGLGLFATPSMVGRRELSLWNCALVCDWCRRAFYGKNLKPGTSSVPRTRVRYLVDFPAKIFTFSVQL